MNQSVEAPQSASENMQVIREIPVVEERVLPEGILDVHKSVARIMRQKGVGDYVVEAHPKQVMQDGAPVPGGWVLVTIQNNTPALRTTRDLTNLVGYSLQVMSSLSGDMTFATAKTIALESVERKIDAELPQWKRA